MKKGRETIYIGEVIKRLRREKGLSQEELAMRSKLDRSYYGELERNEKSPSLYAVMKLARAFEMTPWHLVEEICQNINFEEIFGREDG